MVHVICGLPVAQLATGVGSYRRINSYQLVGVGKGDFVARFSSQGLGGRDCGKLLPVGLWLDFPEKGFVQKLLRTLKLRILGHKIPTNPKKKKRLFFCGGVGRKTVVWAPRTTTRRRTRAFQAFVRLTRTVSLVQFSGGGSAHPKSIPKKPCQSIHEKPWHLDEAWVSLYKASAWLNPY